MTIEVRQVLIRSQVGVGPPSPGVPGSAAAARELERAKAQILAECKAWLREQLQAARER
jgi:Family of unknown function (DUF5908)